MEYFLVEANSTEKLQKEVNDRISQGWQPLGGMAVGSAGAGNWWYYQAMLYIPQDSAPVEDYDA